MNPASSRARIWNNPPPPGTEDEYALEYSSPKPKPEPEPAQVDSPEVRPIDRIDPYLKNPEYIKYEKTRHRSRSRSHSRERHHRRRHSRTRSGDRHRRSHSRRKRRYSSSRSRSPSPSYSRSHGRHRRRYSRSSSRSRSNSRSRSYRSHRSSKSDRSRRSRSRRSPEKETSDPIDIKTEQPEADIEEEEECPDNDPDQKKENLFKNDGSFLEMFKKMQEEQQKAEAEKLAEAKKTAPLFGKRRGGKVLKTGIVEKAKTINEEELAAQDAWSVYMKEVKRYKEACCDDDSKTRPLVK